MNTPVRRYYHPQLAGTILAVAGALIAILAYGADLLSAAVLGRTYALVGCVSRLLSAGNTVTPLLGGGIVVCP